jgi:hypothetical protein
MPMVALFLLQIEQLHFTIFANLLIDGLISASIAPQ